MQQPTGRKWQSLHDLLEQRERYETSEWARLCGGMVSVDWPPKHSRLGRSAELPPLDR